MGFSKQLSLDYDLPWSPMIPPEIRNSGYFYNFSGRHPEMIRAEREDEMPNKVQRSKSWEYTSTASSITGCYTSSAPSSWTQSEAQDDDEGGLVNARENWLLNLAAGMREPHSTFAPGSGPPSRSFPCGNEKLPTKSYCRRGPPAPANPRTNFAERTFISCIQWDGTNGTSR